MILRFFDILVLVIRILVRVLEQFGVIAEPEQAGPRGHEGKVNAESLVRDVSRNGN